jgi:hypothetical protein
VGKQADVYADLVAKVTAVAAALSLPLAVDDYTFETPIDGSGLIQPYLRADMFNNAPFWEGIGTGRLDQGLMTLSLVTSRPHDKAAARAIIDSIIAAYPKASFLAGNGRVKIQRQPWLGSAIPEPDRTGYPITIEWVA